jgi:hypothetical protein
VLVLQVGLHRLSAMLAVPKMIVRSPFHELKLADQLGL